MSASGGVIKGAAIIAAGGFIAKILGAIYRIPLTNLIGGHGIGLYQMAYPVYCILLTVSATGIPSSIAKLTAERIERGESALPLLKKSLFLFLSIGVVGSLIMLVFSPLVAKAQQSEEILFGYFFLAPSVAITSVISVFRGYFQGKNNMLPTALSEIVEQAVKVGVGLLFAYLYKGNVSKAVTALLLGVTLSELAALGLMLLLFYLRKDRQKTQKQGGRVEMKHILRLSIPVTLSAILFPLSTMLDSVLAVRFLSGYTQDAVALYGLFSGGAVTMINLPVSVCYGIAAASVPAVASAQAQYKDENRSLQNTENGRGKKQKNPVRKRIFFSLLLTLSISIPSAVGLYLFAAPAVKIIYRNLNAEELQTLVSLVRTFSLSAVTLSCVQTLSACLTAQGQPKFAFFSTFIGVTVKAVLEFFLLQNPKISVFALAHATNLCYLVAFFLDFLYNLYVSRRKGNKERKKHDHGDRLRQRRG